MNKVLREHADAIVKASIKAVQPDEAVARALTGKEFPGKVVLVSAGKAGWQMAKAAYDCLGDRIDKGGCINTLTSHRPTPYARGNPQHTNLVEVAKAES